MTNYYQYLYDMYVWTYLLQLWASVLAWVLDNINKTNVEKDTSAYYMYDSIHI